jgi:type VI secretion system protein ImpM
MPAEHLTPGFFGKMPAAGDFVSRGLPAAFTRNWDRWASRHLVPLMQSGAWPEQAAIRFLLGSSAFGPAAGVVLSSADRAGRRFPLTVASPLPFAASSLALSHAGWFDALSEAAALARSGAFEPDDLAEELSRLSFPIPGEAAGPVATVVLWLRPDDLVEADPDAPQAALEDVLSPPHEEPGQGPPFTASPAAGGLTAAWSAGARRNLEDGPDG